MKTCLVLALLLATPALAQGGAVELFVDKGDTFIRAGTDQGLELGTEVKVVGPESGGQRQELGTAVVMEIWKKLARVRLDGPAEKAAGPKWARVEPKAASGAASESAGPARGEPKEQTATPVPTRTLKGRAELSGIGPAKRVVVHNRTSFKWTQCEVRLPDNRRYIVPFLAAHDHEGIMLHRFKQDGPQYDRPLDKIAVSCAEGKLTLDL